VSVEELERLLDEFGIPTGSDPGLKLRTFLALLRKWNAQINLTASTEWDALGPLFAEGLWASGFYPAQSIRHLDIGSGAGFPGIPIKIIRPDIQMYLIEPSGKKAAFLRHIVRQIQLEQIAVIEKRIEEIKVNKELPCAVDIGVTRALFDIGKFIKKASHIMRPGGILILNKGPKVHEEVARIGDVSYTLLTVDLPLSDIKRYIVRVTL